MFRPDEHFRKVKGNQDYLEVKWRLVWLRDKDNGKPNWGIETQLISIAEDQAIFHATIKDETGRIIGSGTKSETRKDFPDFIEKAETGAIGRALATAGFGTQFTADEMEENDRLADSPVERSTNRATREQSAGRTNNTVSQLNNAGPQAAPKDFDPLLRSITEGLWDKLGATTGDQKLGILKEFGSPLVPDNHKEFNEFLQRKVAEMGK